MRFEINLFRWTRAMVVMMVFIVCLFLIPNARTTSAHKFHTSFTEMDDNEREHSLEITLRTFPDDLENILSKRAGKSVHLDDKKETGTQTLAYLQETFQLRDALGQLSKLAWVGMEVQVDAVWIYFEAKMPHGLEGMQLRNQFLCDLYEDQSNLVNVKDGNKKTSLTYARGDGFKELTVRH